MDSDPMQAFLDRRRHAIDRVRRWRQARKWRRRWAWLRALTTPPAAERRG